MEELWKEIVNKIGANTTAKSVYSTTYKPLGFCPYLQFIKLDALDAKDYPNGIAENSIFLYFIVNLKDKKVELHSNGHVWLSPRDKATDKYKYLAMRSMVSIAEEKGVKKFRKQGFKSADDLQKKIEIYYRDVMEKVSEYTNGYPYKQGV